MTQQPERLYHAIVASLGTLALSYAPIEAGLRIAVLFVGLLTSLFALAGHVSRWWSKRRNLSSVDHLRHQPSAEPNDCDFD